MSQRKEMTTTEISAYTGITLPTITGILESLVKTRCIIKNRNAEDGRKLVVSISETGSEKLRKFLNLQQMFVERIEPATDKDFLDKLSEVFRTLVRR
ncbi:MAG: MarR family winged helix-turn-helix transcriptional regulator [Thermoplasmataceae archaeon]